MGGMPDPTPRTDGGADPELRVERVPVEQVKPDPFNVRDHNEANLDAIEASLRRFGQRKPLVVTEDFTVAAGNGTLEVIRWRLGWSEIWVAVYDGDPDEARAYAIADNRTGEFGEWNDTALVETLTGLDSDLQDAAGYRPDQVRLLLEAAAATTTEQMKRASKYEPAEFAGQTPGAGLSAQGDLYGEKPSRTLYFEFEKETFDWLVQMIGAYRATHHLDGNADALAGMVEEATGSTAPAAG